MIIRNVHELRSRYHELDAGDAFVGYLSLRQEEQFKVLDLLHRGIRFYPSLLSQFLSRSKVLQADILKQFMLPDTFVAYRGYDLIHNLERYCQYEKIVCKRDRKHLGRGVSSWSSLEELQSLDAMDALKYPLVIQPFLEDARDFRVVIIDSYVEVYERVNPHTFRKNLAQKGTARSIRADDRLKAFCEKIMHRGDFPYALLDVLLGRDNRYYLSEISLLGGLRGSRIGQEGFMKLKTRLEDEFCSSISIRD